MLSNRLNRFAVTLSVWLASELFLGALGLDDLADCTEWVERRRFLQNANVQIV